MPNHAIRRTSLALATATLTAAAMLGTISPASAISGGRNADGDAPAPAPVDGRIQPPRLPASSLAILTAVTPASPLSG